MRQLLRSMDTRGGRRVSGSTETTARNSPRPAEVSTVRQRCACGGQCPRCDSQSHALPKQLRDTMERRLGANFSDVRVFTDGKAARSASDRRAHAFTIGTEIYFGAGRYAPETAEGTARLAHELVHVEQQRKGRRSGAHASAATSEREARELGRAAAGGAHVSVRAASPPVMQRDGEPEGSTGPAATPSATPTLQLDPEIERMMLQHYIRWWLGTMLVAGDAPTALPTAPDTSAGASRETAAVPGVPDLPPAPITSQLPLPSQFFAPLPPDPLYLEPDVGALFTPFGERGAPVGSGDSQLVFDIYRRNQALTRGLPDLRSMAPRFLRPLIPGTWRRDIAGALTSAAVGAALKHDYPTPIEVSDQAWQSMTGVSTTVIPVFSKSFDLF